LIDVGKNSSIKLNREEEVREGRGNEESIGGARNELLPLMKRGGK